MATASRSSAASSQRRSVEIEEVEDEDYRSRNVSPLNASRVIESSDGSDGGEVGVGKRARASSVIDIDNNSSEEVPVAEETDEAERGKICGSFSK